MGKVKHQPANTEASGDPAEWVDRHGNLLMSYALARLPQREVAEDLVQETFLAAWKSRRDFQSQSKFSTWLVGILRRKIADHYRAGGRDMVSLDAEPAEADQFSRWGKWKSRLLNWKAAPDELAQNREFWAVVSACLAELPPHLNYVFRLRELKSASTTEICNFLDISAANVAVRLHRARLLLRQCLEMKWFQNKA